MYWSFRKQNLLHFIHHDLHYHIIIAKMWLIATQRQVVPMTTIVTEPFLQFLTQKNAQLSVRTNWNLEFERFGRKMPPTAHGKHHPRKVTTIKIAWTKMIYKLSQPHDNNNRYIPIIHVDKNTWNLPCHTQPHSNKSGLCITLSMFKSRL